MDLTIVALLVQDGITNGAIYALLALALVLVFAVTRVIFIPSGEFVAYGTLTLAGLQLGKPPGTIGLLVGMALVAGAMEAFGCLRRGEPRRLPRQLALWTGVPLAMAGLATWIATPELPFWAQILVTLALVTALGPLLYRIAYQPAAEASVLVLLIVSVGVHFALTGLGLLFFGAEGSRTPPFSSESLPVGEVNVSVQSAIVVSATLVLIAALYLFFGRTLVRQGAPRDRAEPRRRETGRHRAEPRRLADVHAGGAAVRVLGVLIGPITTVYYDSGFLVSLKGFVGAIIGGLVSYPLAAAGALLVGLLEAFASFWASAFKEVIVFTLIIPVLLWRSLTAHHHEEDE